MTLSPFKRYRVIYTDPDTGRKKSIVAKDNERPVQAPLGNTGVEAVSLTSQRNGSIHIIGKSLVDEIVIEQQDRVYENWVKVGTYDARNTA